MPKIFLEEDFTYTSEQLFSIVADIESYNQFLPWCEGANIVEYKDKNLVIADLIIGYKGINKTYRSQVQLDQLHGYIKVDLISGPFKHLYQEWKFLKTDHGCKVIFDIDFALHSHFLETIIKSITPTICQKFIKAFSERADKLFSK